MKMNKLWACLALVLCLMSSLVSVQAQSSAAYDGLNILFLVDQSGSMGGTEYKSSVPRPATDPLGLRFGAVQYAVRTLSQYRLLIPETVPFQMGVVYFGDNAEIGLNWTTIQTDSDPGWAQLQTELLTQLANTGFGERNLGNTNFIAGFEAVQRMFRTLPTDKHPLNIIVVLTDGSPCAPTHSEWREDSCGDASDKVRHMELLEDLTASAFAPPDYRIYVIALDADGGYWPDFEDYWQTISSNQAVRAETPTEMGQGFLDILAAVVKSLQPTDGSAGTGSTALGEPVILTDGQATVSVPPYHQLLRLNVFKSEPTKTIQVTGPTGSPIDRSTPGVTIVGQEAAIEIWTIANPVPGTWQLTVPEGTDLVDVYMDLLTVNHSLALSNPPYIRSQPINLLLELTDANKQPLPAYANNAYPLNVTAVLHLAGGADETISLPTTGQNRYSAELHPQQAGAYSLDIRATTTNVDGSPLTILDLADVTQFDIQPTELIVEGFPQENLLMSEAITVSAQLMSGGQPISLPNIAFNMVIQNQAGDVWANVPLLDQGDNTFGEQVAMRDPGQYRITISATTSDANGAPLVLGEKASGLFTVDPADLLLIEVEKPTEGSIQNALEGSFPLFFTFAPSDVVVEVKVFKEANGEAVDLSKLTDEDVLTVSLVEDTTGTVYTPETPLYMMSEGLYETVYKALPEGNYSVQVNARTDIELGNATLFAPRTQSSSVHFQRIQNPSWIATVLLTLVSAILVVGIIVFLITRTLRRRRHPIRASLAVMADDEDGNTELQIPFNLSAFNSNYVVLGRKQLRNLPESLRVTRIVVQSLTDRMSERGEIEVSVYKKGKSSAETFRLTSPQPRLLGTTSENIRYSLQKDYDKDFD